MNQSGFLFLLLAASLSLGAAILHFICIVWGANGYRVLGAGEPMVSWAAQGHWYPPLMAFMVGCALTACAVYVLSAAGVVRPLPLLKPVLIGITSLYIARAIAFPLLKPLFPGNSSMFWWVSSGICLLIGCIHLMGIVQAWENLP